MSNSYLTSNLLSKRAAAYFETSSTFIKTANRKYEGMYTEQTYTPGETISARLDNRYLVQRGDTVTAQDIVDRKLSMTILDLFSVPIAYKPTDLQRNIGDFGETFLKPAVNSMCAEMNSTMAQGAVGTLYNHKGTQGTPINTFAAVNNTRATMLDYAMPKKLEWYLATSISDGAALQNSLANQFNESLNTGILREAMLGRLAGFEIFQENSIATHAGSTDTLTGITVKTDVAADSTTVVLTGFSGTESIKSGTLIEFTGYFGMNPVSHQANKQTFQGVTTTDVVAAAGDATVILSTPVIFDTTDALRNVNSQILATTAVVISHNYNANIAYTDMALYAAMPKLDKMDSPDSSVFNDSKTGVSIRVSKTAEVLDNKNIMRLDAQLAYFWNPEQAIILQS